MAVVTDIACIKLAAARESEPTLALAVVATDTLVRQRLAYLEDHFVSLFLLLEYSLGQLCFVWHQAFTGLSDIHKAVFAQGYGHMRMASKARQRSWRIVRGEED